MVSKIIKYVLENIQLFCGAVILLTLWGCDLQTGERIYRLIAGLGLVGLQYLTEIKLAIEDD